MAEDGPLYKAVSESCQTSENTEPRRRCLEGRDIPSMQVLTIVVFEVCDQPLYDGSDTSTPFSSIFHLNLILDVVHKPFLLMLKPSTVYYVERGYGACFC